MNTLTAANIAQIANEAHPEVLVHNVTVAYIQELIRPYAEAINAADVAGIEQWLPLAFHGMAEGMKMSVDAAITKMLSDNPTVGKDETARETVVLYIISELVDKASKYAMEKSDATVIPWDVQAVIAQNPELSKVFGITSDQVQLPIEVVIGPQKFIHQVTLEFTAGLLLFSDKTMGNRDFGVTMFGAPLTSEYMVITEEMHDASQYNRFINPDRKSYEYVLIFGDQEYTFNTPDFMQGFVTGAMWSGVDHRAYWKDLSKVTFAEDGTIANKQRLSF